MILGVDEAGRGPLAGPVAVGAVLVPENYEILTNFPGLNDSKKLSERNRERLFAVLEEKTKSGEVRFAVEMSSAKMIDTEGIAFAVREALGRAVRSLAPEPFNISILLDGSLAAPKEYEQKTLVGGDATVAAIMLASVAAKVLRDRLMVSLAPQYPEYDFAKHKGYGTKFHYEMLEQHGLSAIHRASFIHLDRRGQK
jgi:ribonuclease HII